MAIYSYWFLMALVLLALEMATGTFYLLMLSFAVAAGGMTALLGASLSWQLLLCALSVIAGTLFLRRWKNRQINEVSAANLDIGQVVHVLTWLEDGKARVLYRGAEWDAEPGSADMPHDGTFYIKEMRGSNLILTHNKP